MTPQPTPLLTRLQQVATIVAFLAAAIAVYGSYRADERARDTAVIAVKEDIAAIRSDVREMRMEVIALKVAIARLEVESRK